MTGYLSPWFVIRSTKDFGLAAQRIVFLPDREMIDPPSEDSVMASTASTRMSVFPPSATMYCKEELDHLLNSDIKFVILPKVVELYYVVSYR